MHNLHKDSVLEDVDLHPDIRGRVDCETDLSYLATPVVQDGVDNDHISHGDGHCGIQYHHNQSEPFALVCPVHKVDMCGMEDVHGHTTAGGDNKEGWDPVGGAGDEDEVEVEVVQLDRMVFEDAAAHSPHLVVASPETDGIRAGEE